MLSRKRLYQSAIGILILMLTTLCIMIFMKRDVATTAAEQAIATVTLPKQADIEELDQSTQARLRENTTVAPPTEEQIRKDRDVFNTPEKELSPTPEIAPPSTSAPIP